MLPEELVREEIARELAKEEMERALKSVRESIHSDLHEKYFATSSRNQLARVLDKSQSGWSSPISDSIRRLKCSTKVLGRTTKMFQKWRRSVYASVDRNEAAGSAASSKYDLEGKKNPA